MRDNNLTNKQHWKWAAKFSGDPNKMIYHTIQHNTLTKQSPKFKFGVQIPRNVNEAFTLDNKNGDNY